MSEETRTQEESDADTVEEESVNPALKWLAIGVLWVRGYWDNLADWIHKKRTSESGSARTVGFLVQGAAELLVYLINATILTALITGVDVFTPLVTMPGIQRAIPISIGVLTIAQFKFAWDEWLRPSNESTDTE